MSAGAGMASKRADPSVSLHSKPSLRTTFEIPLHRAPRRYVSGSGPKSQPISLLPLHDSTGYIVDKVVLPTGPLLNRVAQRKLYYIVGWRDIPAARATIEATKVLDYVSPRTLENWEYQRLLKQEDEKKAEEETKLARLTAPGKRRSRPPKGAMADIPPEPVVLDAADEELLARRKAAGPSLSTPQKRRLEDFVEDYAESDDAAIRRQLVLEGMDIVVDSDRVDRLASTNSNSEGEVGRPSRSSSSGRSAHPDPGAIPRSHKPTHALGRSVLNRSSSAPGSPSGTPSHQPQATAVPNGRASSIPLKARPTMKRTRPARSSRTSTPTSGSGLRNIHVPERQKNGTGSQPETPSPRFIPVQASREKKRYQVATTPASNGDTFNTTNLANQVTTTSQSKISVQRTKKKRDSKEKQPSSAPDPALPDDAEQTWEVKRVEDDWRFRTEDGRVVRYFKVRWAGNWPPEQNPTWEPEENLTASMVRSYLKRKRAKGILDDKIDEAPSWVVGKPASPAKKYNSVAEAFEDVATVAAVSGGGDAGADEDDDEDDDSDWHDKLLVTEEHAGRSRRRSRRSSTGRSSRSSSRIRIAAAKQTPHGVEASTSRSKSHSSSQRKTPVDLGHVASFNETLRRQFLLFGTPHDGTH